MKRTLTAVAVAALVPLVGCNVEAIIPNDCRVATGVAFLRHPVAVRDRMQRIAYRESRWQPTARNRTSSATGCFQLLRMHEGRARRLGYTWADMTRALPNARVAESLYSDAGFAPWAVS